MTLRKLIEKMRPNISDTSITTYNSILTNLYKKVFKTKDIEPKHFNDTKQILQYLQDIPYNKRKTILSALYIITNNEKYKTLMLDDIKDYNNEVNKQTTNDKQKQTWVTNDDILVIYETLKNEFNYLINKKNLTGKNLQTIQDFIIVSLYGGLYIAPRRNLDYCLMKIKNIDIQKDNYINKNSLIFNTYKLSNKKGKQEIKLDTVLKCILSKWVKINPTDYLLFDANQNPLTSVKLNQRFNRIFGKNIGVNQLRHTYMSSKYKDTIELNKQMEQDFNDMGSSMIQQKVYIKNND